MKKLLVAASMFITTLSYAQEVYIPNAFTPNGDGRNDIFIPVFDDSLEVKDYNLEIYDRSGIQVFRSNNPTIGWGGLPFDTTYVYKFYVRFKGYNEAIIKTGSVTIIQYQSN